MKRLAVFLLSLVLLSLLCGCDKGMDTTEALLEKVREEFSAEEADDILFAGRWEDDVSALFWFIKNGHTHLLMECTKLDDGGYTFERSYKNPIERGKEIS